jgi:hypothetical protein
MKIFFYAMFETVFSIILDCFKATFAEDDPGRTEIQPIEFVGGYGSRFGADGLQSTHVLQKAISLFGNPLEAVRRMTAMNSTFGCRSMQWAVDSALGCVQKSEKLSALEKET